MIYDFSVVPSNISLICYYINRNIERHELSCFTDYFILFHSPDVDDIQWATAGRISKKSFSTLYYPVAISAIANLVYPLLFKSL